MQRKVAKDPKDFLSEIAKIKKGDLVFTGHSFYNTTIKAPPYITEERNIFDIHGIIPFSVIDDHAYADFMLSRCKSAPQEIIIGSTSHDLLNEFEAVSCSKTVHKIKLPYKIPKHDSIEFMRKKRRATFLGKLYPGVPTSEKTLKAQIEEEKIIEPNEKKFIFEMISARKKDAFYNPSPEKLKVSNLTLLYYDLVDKFYRNFHRSYELARIANAFSARSIPVYIIGGKEEDWSFEGKEKCVFLPTKPYDEAIEFLHHSQFNINLTPSYADVLTGRAVDMMASNSLCISDYTPYYDNFEKDYFYYDASFIRSELFFEGECEALAKMQKDYIINLCGKNKVQQEWKQCIEKAHDIAGRSHGNINNWRMQALSATRLLN